MNDDRIVTRQGAKATLQLSGDIVAANVQNFRQHIKALLQEGVKDVVLDLSQVSMIDSVGLGMLVATCNSMAASKGTLSLTHVSKDLVDLLKSMRLDHRLSISPAPAIGDPRE